jgi:RHS repeat-associated protein
VAGLGGPAPYWHSWTFDVTGNRLSEVGHAATNTTYTYTHPAPGTPRPHTVTNVTAMRTGAGLHWIVADHHGTAEVTINATTLAVAKRRSLPYGETRGSGSGTWPAAMDKGVVGGTKDPTGLTHLGAREYDPTLDRFLSVDPVLDTGDPQQINGYAYAGNNPTTLTDPDGQLVFEDAIGGSVKSPTSSGKSKSTALGTVAQSCRGRVLVRAAHRSTIRIWCRTRAWSR